MTDTLKNTAPELFSADSLFARLRAAAGPDWPGYTGHEFVRRLGAFPDDLASTYTCVTENIL